MSGIVTAIVMRQGKAVVLFSPHCCTGNPVASKSALACGTRGADLVEDLAPNQVTDGPPDQWATRPSTGLNYLYIGWGGIKPPKMLGQLVLLRALNRVMIIRILWCLCTKVIRRQEFFFGGGAS